MGTSVYLFSDCLLLLRVYERVASRIMGHAFKTLCRPFHLGVHAEILRTAEGGHRAMCVEKNGNIV
jgi:hypothetical protein